MTSRLVVLAGLVSAVAMSAPAAAVAGEPAETAPTFNKDVAPILNANCVICHRPNTVAPMSLMSYQDARPWARAIKEKVAAREMPPWFADPRYGRFRNERGLTQSEIDTIVAWADAGAPMGDGVAPAPPSFPEGWLHPSGRPPDEVVEMEIEWRMPAEGELPNFTLYQEIPYQEDRFLGAIQLRPGNLSATHHSSIGVRDLPRGTKLGTGPAWTGGPVSTNVPVPVEDGVTVNNAGDRTEEEAAERAADARRAQAEADVFAVAGTSHLVFYVPGGGFEQWRPGVGKRIRPGKYFSWGLHYTTTGKPETDRHSAGFWWQQVPTTHEILTRRVGETHIAESEELVASPERGIRDGSGNPGPRIPVIPPHDPDWAITAITAFQDDVTLYVVWPHMHLRGKDTTFLVTYPDGREEIVLNVPKYDFNWQLHYELEDPLKLPAGTTIKAVGHFDNSVKNRYNPAPQKEVYWAEQSWDEMFNSWMDYSVDKLDLRLEKKPQTEE